jgi:hypothetical protein
MSREAQIPLVLWITAAIVAHLAGGGGAVEVAQVLEDRNSIRAVVRAVRDGLRAPETTFEILTDNVDPTLRNEQAEAPDKDAPASDVDPNAPPETQKPDPATALQQSKPDESKNPASEPEKPKAPEPEKPKPEVANVEPVKPATPPPPPADHRIAVRQHVEKNQQDNPNANRIADDANNTKEEMVARIRSHDQDDPDPTPGAHAATGPRGEVGDSDHTKIAQSEDKPGDPKNAPGEKTARSTSAEHSNPAPPAPPAPNVARPSSMPGPAKNSQTAGRRASAQPPNPATPPPTAGGAGPSSPETIEGNKGYVVDPANPGGDGSSRMAGRKRPPLPYKSPVKVGQVGLGAPGVPGGPNLNLDMPGVVQAVGSDKLKQERAADGEARRSAHRGSWETNKFERWRAAIENYEPAVKLGNQTSLNAARVPFATYINTIHNRLHPIFAEEFLASLDNLPTSHTLNQDLVTHIEIVLSKDEGRIVRIGVTKASGVTAFDIVALNSVSRASPFGKAPDAIVSPDGNVYLHWEFHRDPFDACTTRNARPFLLKSAPTLTPKGPPPKKAPTPTPADDRNRPLAPRVIDG